ncbi:MAG: hypothetical protein AAFO98_12715 [Pseudomonadota bacterium]
MKIGQMTAKTRAHTLTEDKSWAFRGMLLMMLLAALLISGCSRDRERVAFEGIEFRSKASFVDRKDRTTFEVSVRPFSASADGAREAGRYEATRYCIERYGTSDIIWTAGPDDAAEDLRVEGDTLNLAGTCNP